MTSLPSNTLKKQSGKLQLMQRAPKRVTATLNWQLFQELHSRSLEEGRSVSNLVCYLLETGIKRQ